MKKKCLECKREFVIPMTEEQVASWKSGAHIQNVIPHVPEDLRELLISGFCGKCFDKIFEDEEDMGDEEE